MGEPELIAELGSESAFAELAGECARAWRAAHAWPLVLGLTGDLGSGKTTWVRAMSRGLGYEGRVPSPTYTLLEHYPCGELTLVHAIDNLGGKLGSFDRLEKSLQDGERWSRFDRALDGSAYFARRDAA